MRYQDPSDVSCGVQALGMALDGLDGAAPASASLLGFLQGNGLIYNFGTGVEDLPVYKAVTIDEGHWQTRTVTKCRTETYVKAYTSRTKRIREPDGRWLTMPVQVPIYGTRSVPYIETERRGSRGRCRGRSW